MSLNHKKAFALALCRFKASGDKTPEVKAYAHVFGVIDQKAAKKLSEDQEVKEWVSLELAEAIIDDDEIRKELKKLISSLLKQANVTLGDITKIEEGKEVLESITELPHHVQARIKKYKEQEIKGDENSVIINREIELTPNTSIIDLLHRVGLFDQAEQVQAVIEYYIPRKEE